MSALCISGHRTSHRFVARSTLLRTMADDEVVIGLDADSLLGRRLAPLGAHVGERLLLAKDSHPTGRYKRYFDRDR